MSSSATSGLVPLSAAEPLVAASRGEAHEQPVVHHEQGRDPVEPLDRVDEGRVVVDPQVWGANISARR